MQVTGNNSIDYNKSEQYTLSIRLSTDGFSFSIYNPIYEHSLSFFTRETDPSLSLTANLKEAFKDTELLSYTYRKVKIMITGNRYTNIPLEIFEEEQVKTLFDYNHPPKENEEVCYNILPQSNQVIAFGVDKSLIQLIRSHYPEAKFYARVSPLIDYLTAKSRQGNSKKMYATFYQDNMDVFCYEHGKLLLINTFKCNDINDRIYYLLYIWKQLDFDQERDELRLADISDDKQELLTEIKEYIHQVFVMNPENNIDMQALLTCE